MPRTGVPKVPGLDWAPFDLASRTSMIFGRTTRVVRDAYGDERRLLDAIRARQSR